MGAFTRKATGIKLGGGQGWSPLRLISVVMSENNMNKWIPNFLSEFHKAVMKPSGYKKDGRKFNKDQGEYWERIYFQGSPMMPYCFYINIGIEFKDVRDYDCRYNFVLVPSTHWAVRIGELVSGAPGEWIE